MTTVDIRTKMYAVDSGQTFMSASHMVTITARATGPGLAVISLRSYMLNEYHPVHQ